jgi:hypothetical protein
LSSPPEQLRIKLGRGARIGGQELIPAKLAMLVCVGSILGIWFSYLCVRFLLRQFTILASPSYELVGRPRRNASRRRLTQAPYN